MQLKTSCPHCKAHLSFHSKLAGRSANCPKCQTGFIVTESPTAAENPEATVLAIAPSVAISNSTTVTFKSASSSDAVPPVGQLGKYQIRGTLGRGGFGVVYQAFDPQLERLLALKVPTFGPEEVEKARRFRDEAKAAAQLRHPNIVPVYESGKVEDRYYIASQFIDGQPLAAVIKAGPVALRDAAAWCAKIAEALAYAHEMKIVHRDVKPQNIMLDGRGEPQLMDFGLAKRLDDAAGMTGDGTILGTPAYMAPEQARGDVKRVGAQTDQYAVGVTLYELLTGRRPFVGDAVAVLHQIIHEEPTPLSRVNPQIPRDLEAITQKAMSKELSRRYADCRGLADDLRHWLAGEPTLARPISAWERLTRWANRNRTLAAAFTATAAALVLVAVLGVALASYFSYANRQIQGEQGKTKTALEDAKAKTKLAEDRLEESQANAYVTTIRLADVKWNEGDVENATALLDSLRPQPGAKDRRGWEWNYLWNRSHNEVARIDGSLGGAQGYVFSVQFSPDGRSLLYCNHKGAFLHDVRTGELMRRWKDDSMPHGMSACAFSRDGRSIFTASSSGPFTCWDAQTGEKRFSVKIHDQFVKKIYATEDGKQVLTFAWGVRNRTRDRLDTWNAETGELLHTLELRTQETAGYGPLPHVSPDGQLLRFAEANFLGGDQPWDHFHIEIKSGERIKVQGNINSLYVGQHHCLSSDGRLFASFQGLRGIQIVDLIAEKLLLTIPLVIEPDQHLDGYRIRFSVAGDRIAAYVQNGIKIWDAATGEELLHIRGAAHPMSFDFSPDGRWLVTNDRQGVICIWDSRTGSDERRVNANGWFTFSDANKKLNCAPLYTSGYFHVDAKATQYDARSGELETQFQLSNETRKNSQIFAFALNGTRLLTANHANTNEQKGVWWECQTGKQLFKATTELYTDVSPLTMSLSADGKYWANTRMDKPEVEIRDLNDGSVVQTFPIDEEHKHLPKIFDRAGSRVLIGYNSWDMATKNRICSLMPDSANRAPARLYYQAVAYNPVGDQIIVLDFSGGASGTLRMLDGQNGRWIRDIGQRVQDVRSLTFSADGRRIIGMTWKGSIRLWDIDTGQELLDLSAGYQDQNWNEAISPDGTQILGQFIKFNPEMAKFDSGSVIWDGRPETEWKTRAAERAARSTVAYFREKTKSQDELVAAIKADPTINEETRALAVEFASRPPVKIVELQPEVTPDVLCIRKAFAAHRANDPQQLTASQAEAERDFPDDELLHRKIAHLWKLLNPAPLVKLAELPASVKSVPLADVLLEAQSVGWDQLMRNRSGLVAHNNVLLEVKGTFFESGLWAHAPARHVVRLDGGWKEFTTQFGIRDESIYGSVVFVVRSDGKELFRSETMTPGKIGELKVSVADSTELELVVEDAGNGTNSDWGLWLNPQLIR